MKFQFAASLLVALFAASPAVQAASPVRLSGALAGSVKDVSGVPQMGATVLLFNRYDKLIQKSVTSASGDFAFDSLLPDLYSVKVTLTSFVPAIKRNISIQPGMRSFLAINLANVLSSVELVYSAPQPGALMSDDWKWVLRSSMSTRPVLRLLPEFGGPSSSTTVFSDTHGLVRVSSGETSPFTPLGNQPDLGTAFALATSFYGANRLQFSGNIGYAADGSLPAASFRTTFSRSETDTLGPQVKLTMQQVMLPGRTAAAMGGQADNLPALRRMSVTLIERLEILDGVELDYGASLESVQFFDRLNYASPFARLTYGIGDFGVVEMGFSSGAPPVDLLAGGRYSDPLQQDLAALSLLPRVSMRNGRAQVQRSQNYEIGYRVDAGGVTLSIGAYRERMSNAVLTMSVPGGFYDSADLLPELSSSSSVFNIGGFERYGYTASATQTLGDHQSFTLAYGNGGVLKTEGARLATSDPAELRGLIRRGQQRWVMVKTSGVAPLFGTRYTGSYQWTDYASLIPSHVYLTQRYFADAGLNIRLRQPIPRVAGFAGRLEATAELRNLLAQGYLSIPTVDGRRLLLTHSPRAVRGGLSFIF